MQSVDEARELARMMVQIAHLAGRRAAAVISDMNQPLGNRIGNALEVVEAIETLQGHGPADLTEHSLEVASHLVNLAGAASSVVAARQKVDHALESGLAWKNFRRLVQAQGGDVSYIDQPEKLTRAQLVEPVSAPRSGYLSQVHARVVGEMAVVLGAGRLEKGQPVDHAVGIEVHHKVGDYLEQGQPLFTIHANDETSLGEARKALLEAHQWSDDPVAPLPLFYEIVTEQNLV